jgi:hypothetical protein
MFLDLNQATDKTAMKRRTIYVTLWSVFMHSVHAQKESYYYLSARHKYQLIFADIC